MDRWATVHGVTKSWTWLSNRAVLSRTFTRKAHRPLLCPSCPQTKGPPRHVTGLHRNCFVKCRHFISSAAHDFGKRDQQMFLQGKFSFLQPLAWHPSKPLLSQDIAILGGSSCFCALKHLQSLLRGLSAPGASAFSPGTVHFSGRATEQLQPHQRSAFQMIPCNRASQQRTEVFS